MRTIVLSSLIAIAACTNKTVTEAEKIVQTVGLCSPIQLQPEETVVFLGDYFLAPEKLDSIYLPAELQWNFTDSSKSKLLVRGNLKHAYGTFSAFCGGDVYDILIKRSAKQKVVFSFNPGDLEISSLQIRGSFNAWNKEANTFREEDDTYETDLILKPGTYEYLLIINGKEQLDPTNPVSAENGQGGKNSILKIDDPSQNPTAISTATFNDTSVAVYAPLSKNQDVIAFWENQILPQTSSRNDTFFYAIPQEALEMERSFVRVYSGNETKMANDLLIPFHHRMVLNDAAYLTRNDWEAASMYFLMIDRFKNGNANNDSTVHDANISPKANYFGGDIAGITQEIEAGFFDSLGLNTVWISPITQNPWNAWGLWDKGGQTSTFSGYHGYWPISNVRPDSRYASPTEVQQFLDVAHADNNNVLLDYVANHVHELHPIYKEHKDWATDLYLPDGRMNTEMWDEQRLTTWFDTFLPTLDLRKHEVVDPMADSALVWIEKYNFDGFRHDATKHIDELYWRTLTERTKKRVVLPQQKRVYQIGETYGSPELIASYIGSGMLDAQFDFNLYDAAVGAFSKTNGGVQRLAEVLESSLAGYGHHHLMGNISGNQDRARFISYASGDLRLDEDAKLAGWSREIGKPKSVAYKKLALLHAFNFAVPGIPVIYYGDEYGMPGAGDPDNRRMMTFDGYDADELALLSEVKALVKLRNSNMALLYGSTEIEVVNADVLIIHRQYFDENVWIIINNGEEEVSIDLDTFTKNGAKNLEEGPAGDLYMELPNKGSISLMIHENSFGTLISKN